MKQRIFGLDILRTIAILAVVIGHIFYTLPVSLPAYVNLTLICCILFDGVNMFFTLSGFLIGSILLKKLTEKPSFSTITTFWRDRWLRTLPAYFFVLIVIILVEGGHFSEFKRHVVFLQNQHTGEFNSFRESWRILMVLPTRIDAVIFGLLGAYLRFYKFKIWSDYRNLFFWIGVIGFFANHYYGVLADFNFYIKYLHKQVELVCVLMTLPKLSSIEKGKGLIAQAVTFIALISYSIYLVHGTIFIKAIRPLLPNDLMKQAIAYFAWAFIAAYVLNATVEKWGLKLRDYLKSKAKKRSVLADTISETV